MTAITIHKEVVRTTEVSVFRCDGCGHEVEVGERLLYAGVSDDDDVPEGWVFVALMTAAGKRPSRHFCSVSCAQGNLTRILQADEVPA